MPGVFCIFQPDNQLKSSVPRPLGFTLGNRGGLAPIIDSTMFTAQGPKCCVHGL